MKKKDIFKIALVSIIIIFLYTCFNSNYTISTEKNSDEKTNKTDNLNNNKAVNLSAVNSVSWDNRIYISGDELTMYFHSNRVGGHGSYDLWTSKRKNVTDSWEEPENISSPINSIYEDFSPCISENNLILYFCSDRPGGFGEYDIWYSTRKNETEDWDEPRNLGPMINSKYSEMGPTISPNGLELYFSDYSYSPPRPEGHGQEDIWVSTRKSEKEEWGIAKNLGPEVNSKWLDFNPFLSRDGLLLFFVSQRDDNPGNMDIWYSCRDSINKKWKEPKNIGSRINSSKNDIGGWLSKDKTQLYFGSNRPNGIGLVDLWMIEIREKLEY